MAERFRPIAGIAIMLVAGSVLSYASVQNVAAQTPSPCWNDAEYTIGPFNLQMFGQASGSHCLTRLVVQTGGLAQEKTGRIEWIQYVVAASTPIVQCAGAIEAKFLLVRMGDVLVVAANDLVNKVVGQINTTLGTSLGSASACNLPTILVDLLSSSYCIDDQAANLEGTLLVNGVTQRFGLSALGTCARTSSICRWNLDSALELCRNLLDDLGVEAGVPIKLPQDLLLPYVTGFEQIDATCFGNIEPASTAGESCSATHPYKRHKSLYMFYNGNTNGALHSQADHDGHTEIRWWVTWWGGCATDQPGLPCYMEECNQWDPNKWHGNKVWSSLVPDASETCFSGPNARGGYGAGVEYR